MKAKSTKKGELYYKITPSLFNIDLLERCILGVCLFASISIYYPSEGLSNLSRQDRNIYYFGIVGVVFCIGLATQCVYKYWLKKFSKKMNIIDIHAGTVKIIGKPIKLSNQSLLTPFGGFPCIWYGISIAPITHFTKPTPYQFTSDIPIILSDISGECIILHVEPSKAIIKPSHVAKWGSKHLPDLEDNKENHFLHCCKEKYHIIEEWFSVEDELMVIGECCEKNISIDSLANDFTKKYCLYLSGSENINNLDKAFNGRKKNIEKIIKIIKKKELLIMEKMCNYLANKYSSSTPAKIITHAREGLLKNFIVKSHDTNTNPSYLLFKSVRFLAYASIFTTALYYNT